MNAIAAAMSLHTQLNHLAASFAQSVFQAIRNVSLEELVAETGGLKGMELVPMTERPRKGAPRRERTPRRGSSRQEMGPSRRRASSRRLKRRSARRHRGKRSARSSRWSRTARRALRAEQIRSALGIPGQGDAPRARRGSFATARSSRSAATSARRRTTPSSRAAADGCAVEAARNARSHPRRTAEVSGAAADGAENRRRARRTTPRNRPGPVGLVAGRLRAVE